MIKWAKGRACNITKEIETKLRKQAHGSGDIAYLKLFTPDAGATWHISEMHGHGDECIMFGLCDLGMGYPELGYVALSDIANTRGHYGLPIERDMHWEPKPLSEVMNMR
jgi:hypothetical protein